MARGPIKPFSLYFLGPNDSHSILRRRVDIKVMTSLPKYWIARAWLIQVLDLGSRVFWEEAESANDPSSWFRQISPTYVSHPLSEKSGSCPTLKGEIFKIILVVYSSESTPAIVYSVIRCCRENGLIVLILMQLESKSSAKLGINSRSYAHESPPPIRKYVCLCFRCSRRAWVPKHCSFQHVGKFQPMR